MRELDRRAIAQHGIAGVELMARAGAAALRALRARLPRARRIAVVCGAGNNGGDGYVVARLAHAAGLEPLVMALGGQASGDAATARAQCEAAGIATQVFQPTTLGDADVIVDALFGIGLARDVAGEWRHAIEAINVSGRPVMAIDIPSGLNADTGAVMGTAVRARITVSFIGLKVGLYTAAGREHAGEILFDDLGVPDAVYQGIAPVAQRLGSSELRPLVRARARDTHKGTFGHVLVVGGGPGMAGAARLCGEAAYRAGSGLVTLATHPSHAAVANAARPELLAFGVRTPQQLHPLLASASAIVLGPGLSRGAWARAQYGAALKSKLPLVVDADGLNLLAAKPRKNDHWILTPHPGEAARLLATTPEKVQRNRFAAVRELVTRFGGVSVLKGSGTLIATHGHETVALCDRGNPGMASGGTGDVLTGVIAALLAQGLAPFDAARLGVWLHAAAGDDAVANGEIGLIASDLISHIPGRINRLVADDDIDDR